MMVLRGCRGILDGCRYGRGRGRREDRREVIYQPVSRYRNRLITVLPERPDNFPRLSVVIDACLRFCHGSVGRDLPKLRDGRLKPNLERASFLKGHRGGVL